MGLFGKKDVPIWSPSNSAGMEIVPAQPEYETVLAWLIGLSDDDYVKVVKVADIHRKAYSEAANVLEEPLDPTTFIHPPEEEENLKLVDQYTHHIDHERPDDFLHGGDDISSAFLEEEPKPKAKQLDGVKSTKVKVK